MYIWYEYALHLNVDLSLKTASGGRKKVLIPHRQVQIHRQC